jgi:arylsulfatase A-like enzyme/Flp pilus assembly protein TadD
VFAAGIAGGLLSWLTRTPQPLLPPAASLRGANILLVTIDTLRADRLGAYGASRPTPTLDALAAEGLRYTHAYAHAVMTLPSHASLLTGLVPPRHGVRNNGAFRLRDDVVTLPERLRDAGYRTGAFVGAFVLDRRFGLAQGFDAYDDRIAEGSTLDFRIAERPAERVLAAARDWLLKDDPRPWFAWVHLFDPHTPYRSGAYDDEVAYVDAQLRTFVAALRDAGRLQRTIVVATADHGEALGEHGEATHGLFAYEPTLRVPLLVAGPGIGPGVVELPAAHVDVAPTLLSLIGVSAGDVDGEPLSAASYPPGARSIYFEALDANLTRGWAPLTGVVANGWKYIDLPRPELYDLAKDAEETVNVIGDSPERARELARQLDRWRTRTPPQSSRVSLDADAKARLQSLGYASGSPATPRVAYTEGDDPKTLLPLHRKFMSALERAENGDADGALAELREVIGARPTFAAAYMTGASILIGSARAVEAVALLDAARAAGVTSPELEERRGAALLAAGNPAAAIAALEPVVAGSRDAVDALNTLAVALLHSGRAPEARRMFSRALELDPASAGIWTNVGLLELRTGRPLDAARAFETAAEIDPTSIEAWRGLGAAQLSAHDARGAAASWRHAVELDPSDDTTLFNLAVLLAEVSPADAAPFLRRFLDQPNASAADRAHIRQLLDGLASRKLPTPNPATPKR